MSTLVSPSAVGKVAKTLGKLVGNTVIFTGTHTVAGKERHPHLSYRSAENHILPKTYGRTQVQGLVLWMSEINEYIKVDKRRHKFLSQNTHTEYTYTVSIAFALCEGPISSIGRIWANDVLITDRRTIRTYLGHKKQQPDPYLEALFGENTPTYDGIAYVMLQEFNISSFDNTLPEFKFEVFNREMTTDLVENLIHEIVVIPGAGEFVYDTQLQYEKEESGAIKMVNQHHTAGIANSIVSIEQLQDTLPNLQWVAPVTVWFATDINIERCEILPKVEKNHISYESELWKVSTFSRKTAKEVLKKEDGQINYGGTPTDSSIVRYLKHLKSKGLQVMFYPMLFVDQIGKPWRGRITGSADAVHEFFCKENGYNNFILHYARLVKDHVNAFLIGSEMESLTRIQNENGEFVAVNELVKLADEVKKIVGNNVKVSYAANWSEYHSHEGMYHLDKLWASNSIDFVGIDAYFPLTNANEVEYDVQKIIHGWDSGEGCNFHYKNDEKIQLDKKSAWKNITYWWENTHINSDGIQTEWRPKMKKVWFTEYGFASISCSSNQPNVFIDESSRESCLPKGSNGQANILAQRAAIQATQSRWLNSEMVERKFLWTWDARPYPTWPERHDIWSDSRNWTKGHWVNGKLGAIPLSDVITDICARVGFTKDDIDVTKLHGLVHGFLITEKMSAKRVIDDLQIIYGFNFFEYNGKIHFVSNQNERVKEVLFDNLLINTNPRNHSFNLTEASPFTVKISHLNEPSNKITLYYTTPSFEVKKFEYHPEKSSKTIEFELPTMMTESDAERVVKNMLQEDLNELTKYKFTLPINDVFKTSDAESIQPGNVLQITYHDVVHKMQVISMAIKRHKVRFICKKYTEAESLQLTLNSPVSKYKDIHNILPISHVEVFFIPGQNAIGVAAAGHSKNWYGCKVDYVLKNNDTILKSDTILCDKPSVIGNVESYHVKNSEALTVDRESYFVVKLIHGQIFSVSEESMFINHQNLALIGNEIVKFSSAVLQKDGTYLIRNLLRNLYGTTTEKYDRFVLLNENTISKIPLDKNVNNIEISHHTFLDKIRLNQFDNSQVIVMKNDGYLLSPVRIKINKTKVSWTPRVLSNELFENNVKHGFVVKFTDEFNNILHKVYTDNHSCEIPQNIQNFKVIVNAFEI